MGTGFVTILVLVLFLLREVYLGYKYGNNEPIKSKKGLQRSLKYLFLVCLLCFIIVEIVLPMNQSKEVVTKYTDEELEEIREFDDSFSLSTYDYYQGLYLQKEMEFKLVPDKMVHVNYHFEKTILSARFDVVEKEDLKNTIKIKILEAPLIDTIKGVKVIAPTYVEIEEKMENRFTIQFGSKEELLTVNTMEEEFFKQHPWIFGNFTFYSNSPQKVFIIVFEVPVGTKFINEYPVLN